MRPDSGTIFTSILKHYIVYFKSLARGAATSKMEDFEDFEAVFGSELDLVFHRDDIRKHRNALEGELFVDRLLRAIGIPNG